LTKNRCKTKDVAGLEGAKKIQEIVEFLKNPEKYTNLGGKIQKEHYLGPQEQAY
jgi:ATP-dependent Zn protease